MPPFSESTTYQTYHYSQIITDIQCMYCISKCILAETVSELENQCFEKTDTEFMHDDRLYPASCCLFGQWTLQIHLKS